MEIQAITQTAVSTTSNSSSTASSTANGALGAGANNSLNGQASGGFSATLNGILTAAPAGNAVNNQIALTGLNVLVQLMASLNTDATAVNEASVDGSIKQLDVLINVLSADSEDSAKVLDSPDVQAWLAELQALLLTQPQANSQNSGSENGTEVLDSANVQSGLGELQVLPLAQPQANLDTPTQPLVLEEQGTTEGVRSIDSSNSVNEAQASSTTLNPLLFVPIETTNTSSESSKQAPTVVEKQLGKAEAVKLLETFNQLLKASGDKAELPQTGNTIQTVLSDLQKMVASFVQAPSAAQASTEVKTEQVAVPQVVAPIISEKPNLRNFGNVSHLGRAIAHKTNNSEVPFQVVLTSVNPKLEYLAAISVQPKLTADNSSSNDGPLFEPLQELPKDSTNGSPAIPMHEFLKQVQTAQPLAKAPVIMMQAPTFVEDMTQFVIKSFTLETDSNGFTEAKLSLYPQNLGQVDVKLTMHNGQLVAQFMADSSLGKEMLESQMSQLRTTLQSQGIQVEKLEVSQNQAFQSGMFQEQRQQQSQQSNKQQKGNNVDNIISIEDELNQEASSTITVPAGSGKSSIDTTA
jgi:flagellar hook-length control protein FliK